MINVVLINYDKPEAAMTLLFYICQRKDCYHLILYFILVYGETCVLPGTARVFLGTENLIVLNATIELTRQRP